ncbi:O-antigen ligase family protein [Archangium primigenium]|uniref:O-antigen ligase family protein n=1 Tax=[Archangium] primigenium TaxID=2792470 RepID=UPI00195D8E25|nr:O-antigen ligase family protein [Archangium primigenium]MBM7112986.1 O-antigen ligase family protein [Archangium primigenium]
MGENVHKPWLQGRAVVVLCAVLVCLAVAAQVPWTQSAAVLPRRLALHLLTVGVLLHAARRPRWGAVALVAGALGAWWTVTWRLGESPWWGAPRWLDGLVALVLLSSVAGGRLPRRFLLVPLMALGGAGALLGLVQQWVDLPWLLQATRPAAFFVSRAVAGEFVAASLLLAVGFLLGRGRPWALVLVGVQVAFLVSTRSRTGWAVAAVGLLWMGWHLDGPRRHSLAAVVGLSAGLAVLFTPGPRLAWQAPNPYADSLGSLSRLELSGRWVTWRNTWALVMDHPGLGVGPGGFSGVYPAYHRAVVRDEAFSAGQQIEEPHHELLRVAVESGLPGVGLVLLLGGVLLRGVPRRPGRRTAALLGAGGALVLSSCVSLTFVAPPTLLLATCVAGLLARTRSHRRFRGRPVGVSLAAASLLGLVLWMDVPLTRASIAWRKGEEAAARGLLRSATEGLSEAMAQARDVAVHARLAEVSFLAGDMNRCVQVARGGLHHLPRSTRLLFLLGECEAARGNTAAAREAHARGLRLLPDNPHALWGLARLGSGEERVRLLLQAREALEVEASLLPSTHAWREREQLQRLSQEVEAALAGPHAE